MSFGIRILTALAALLALAGVAAAQECPECDADGEPGTSGTYNSIDTGYVTDHGLYLVDTDMSVSDPDDPKGFWAWISVCITAIVDCFENVLGYDTGFHESTDLYVSEDGIDLDSTIRIADPACELLPEECVLSFDESELGQLDDMTWQGSTELHDMLGAGQLTEGLTPDQMRELDGIDVDECIHDEGLAPC